MTVREPEKEYFQFIIEYVYDTSHTSLIDKEVIEINEMKVWKCGFHDFVPVFMRDKLSIAFDDFNNKHNLLVWLQEHGFFKKSIHPVVKCPEHEKCAKRHRGDVFTKIKMIYPFGLMQERRLVTFLMGAHQKNGDLSSVRWLSSPLGDKHIVLILKDFI